MVRLPLLLFLCVAAFTSVACGRRLLYIASAENGDGLALAKQMQGPMRMDVHGFYGDVVVASGASGLSLQLRAVGAATVVHYPSYTNTSSSSSSAVSYFVLERQEKQYDAPLTVSVGEGVQLLYSSYNRVVVSTTASILPLNDYNVDLEIIPVDTEATVHLGLTDTMTAMLEKVYGHVTQKYVSDGGAAAPDPTIAALVNAVDPAALKGFVTYLTGENTASNILTRNSRSTGAVTASQWLTQQFKSFGLTATTEEFRSGFSSNVIGIRQGDVNPSKVVVIGAHYDSRGPDVNSATQRAPGANDNGSGSGAVLHIAQIFDKANVKFNYTIHFVLYSGEEQGLYGSAAYAQKLVDAKVDVVGVFNADMIAYRAQGEATQCAFPSRYSTTQLENLARSVVATYVPALVIGTTTACCSDHQSYYNRGLPATGFFERNGPIADNQYHKSGDLVDRTGFDIAGQYTLLTKAVLASVATLAGAY